MNHEDLILHAGFVRALARSLVWDENRADDIEQQTWMIALRKPPMHRASARAWFRKVIRNLVRTTRRGEERRRKYEEAAPPSPAVPSPEEIVARGEAGRMLIEAVLALEEPYRSTLLLRYYEDVPPSEIAARLQVPEATIRTRLRRGLERLRVVLDARHDQDRGKWVLALCPLAGLKAGAGASPPAAAAAASSTLVAGVLAMSIKVKIGIAASLIAIGTLAVWGLLPTDTPLAPETHRQSTIVSQIDGSPPEAPAQGQEAEAPSPADAEPERVALDASGILLEGRVIDKVSRGPVTAFHVRITRKEDEQYVRVAEETVRAEDGRFAYRLEKEGSYCLTIRSSRYPDRREDLQIASSPPPPELLIELDPGESVSGRVVEDATGKPVENAIVGARTFTYLYGIQFISPEYSIHAVTDREGKFTLQGLDRSWADYDERDLKKYGQNWWLFAVHPDFAQGYCEAIPGDAGLEIRLKRGFLVHGRAFDDQGKVKPGVLITLISPLFSEPKPGFKYWGGPHGFRPVMTGPDGSYHCPALPGELQLEAAPPPGVKEEDFGFLKERKRAQVIDHDLEVDFGRPEEYATWRGTLFDPLGAPVSGGRVGLGGKEAPGSRIVAMGRSVTCDGQGRFEVRKIAPGRYTISVEFPGMLSTRLGEMTFEEPKDVAQDIHVGGGVIQGEVLDGDRREPLSSVQSYVSAGGPNQAQYSFHCLPEMNGRFVMNGLVPGKYQVCASADGFVSSAWKEMDVEDGMVTGDVLIELHRGGRVHCCCTGFEKDQHFNIHLVKQGEASRTFLRPYFLEEKGIFETTQNFEPGTYTAECAWVDKGRSVQIVKQVEVALGRTTELLLRPEDFEPSSRNITLLGQLLYTDGEPVREGKILFSGSGIPGMEKKEDWEKTSEVDEEGRFTLSGFKPGSWWVRVLLPESGLALPPQLIIPEDAPSSLPYTLRLHRGIVAGSLRLCQRGLDLQQRLDRYFNQWVVNLLNEASGTPVMATGYGSWDNRREDRFRMEGIAPGTYRLVVHRKPFTPYVSPPFTLREGEQMDFGEIVMELAPAVIVEALTPSGQPAESCYAQFPDLPDLTWDSRLCVGKGKYLYFDMPAGPVRFRFQGDGWRENEQTIQIRPDVIDEVSVIMKPE